MRTVRTRETLMNLSSIDWIILGGLFVVLNVSGYLCRKYIKGVADFLVAGRGVGRYLGVGAASMMGVGAVTILGMWQQNYKAGFVGQWWFMLTPAGGIVAAVLARVSVCDVCYRCGIFGLDYGRRGAGHDSPVPCPQDTGRKRRR